MWKRFRETPLSGCGKSDETRILSEVYRDNLESTYSCRPCRILCPGELDFWRRGYNERHPESVSNSGQRFLSQPPLIDARRKQTRDKARFFFSSRSVFKLITKEAWRRSNPFLSFCGWRMTMGNFWIYSFGFWKILIETNDSFESIILKLE